MIETTKDHFPIPAHPAEQANEIDKCEYLLNYIRT